jgi:hypothetical protein
LGFRIFAHAVGLVFRHFGDALRISAVPYLLGFLLLTGGTTLVVVLPMTPGKFDPLSLLPAGLIVLAFAVANMWVAVAWHRYVLLDEMPGSFTPRFFHVSRILAYFGRSLLLGLIAFALLFVAGIIINLALTTLGGASHLSVSASTIILQFIALAVAYLLIAALIYRWGLILPAAAIGKPLRIRDAWSATSGAGGTILGLAVLSAVAVILIAVAGTALSTLSPWLALAWHLIAGWLEIIVGVSILTTLYGYYVEKRQISQRPEIMNRK